MTPLILSLHENLEILHLPIAMAPLSEMSAVDWPRLREIKLYGEIHDTGNPADLAYALPRMRQLRILDLPFFHKGS